MRMAFRLVSNITEFSDDILLYIFFYLSSWDLLNVLDTCQRFNKVGKDHSLWRTADFSDGSLTAAQITQRVLHCLQPCTKHLHLKGQKRKFMSQRKWKTDLMTPTLMKKIGIKCPSLQELHLTEAVVDARKFKLINFGELKELKILCVCGCELINLPSPAREGSYFRNMHTILPKLESLEISNCKWINDYDLMALSKLDSLKKLILKCDLRIGSTIAYLSISFRFGFKNLEELDLRGTSLQDNDIQSVLQSGKLKYLSIGPIGRVKRLNDESYDGLNLVMSDPHWRDEPKQQVVVINMGPNGPHWQEASDEELDKMGLQWVKNGLNRYRQKPEKEEHYFFGKEGRIVKDTKSEGTSGECSQSAEGSKKRKLDEDGNDSDVDGEQIAKQPRKKSVTESNFDCSSSEEEDEEKEEEEKTGIPVEDEASMEAEERNLPDECLSDRMAYAFEDHANNLNSLVLAGCAITDAGLLDLVRYIPTLTYFDVSNTLVTTEGVQDARLLLPECRFVRDINTPPTAR